MGFSHVFPPKQYEQDMFEDSHINRFIHNNTLHTQYKTRGKTPIPHTSNIFVVLFVNCCPKTAAFQCLSLY